MSEPTVPSDAASPRQSPLHAAHLAAGGKLVDFAGWRLPIHYGSLIDEHRAVRTAAGVFDVSHMTVVDVSGSAATGYLRKLVTGDVATLVNGGALYGCLCRPDGGTLDDLIVYRLDADRYRLIVNAATRAADLDWLRAHRDGHVVVEELDALAMLAVQGPHALDRLQLALERVRPGLVPSDALAQLARFTAREEELIFIARTGYTGEDGCEILMPPDVAVALWEALLAEGVSPCGLGARDTLRLEAGMCLYGQDLDPTRSPVECGIGWAVDLSDPERDFIGREVLEDHKAFGGPTRRIGLLLEGRGVLRAGQTVQYAGRDIGRVTSGTFSPTREQSIALASVTKDFHGACDVLIRDRPVAARRVSVPFVRNGVPIDEPTA